MLKVSLGETTWLGGLLKSELERNCRPLRKKQKEYFRKPTGDPVRKGQKGERLRPAGKRENIPGP